MCAGTYSITIYCRHSLDFIIGYFKAFSNAIFNFDSYGISIDFSDDNSKTFDDGGFNSFEDGVAELRSGVKVCVRGPPYTTAPPCNAWGNAPVDDS